MTPDHRAALLAKIRSHDALVGIIGMGYVGLPLALAFVEKGFRVLGFDVDTEKVAKLERGEGYIKHLDGGRIAAAAATGRLVATTDFARLREADAILICVPTPLTLQREPDMTYVDTAGRQIRAALRPGQLVVLESTTYPGTTDERLRAILEGGECNGRPPGGRFSIESAGSPTAGQRPAATSATGSECSGRPPGGRPSIESSDAATAGQRPAAALETGGEWNGRAPAFRCGTDFFLAFSPEREDPGNKNYGTTNTPKVVGGVDEVSGDLAQALYDEIISCTVRVSSARTAEAAKLTENIFRAVNIALVNELKVVYDRMGIDVWEVLDAAETKPFGFMRFNPGPGWGGHCIPLDPFYLSWKARETGEAPKFIELAGDVNVAMPRYVVEKLQLALNERRKAVKGSKVLVLGLAYKKDIDDPRESPAFELVALLLGLGAEVTYHDPHVPVAPRMRSWPRLPAMESQPLTAASLEAADAVLVVTDHSAVDYDLVARHAQLIVDTRGVWRQPAPNIVKA